MASSAYGRKLNPHRRLRDPLGAKGVRQSVVVTNNPSTIDQNQQLLVRFPNLGAHDVIAPGTARLAFTVSLTSTDANRTVVQNVGCTIMKKTTIKISGNEVLSIDDSDIYGCYWDLWRTAQERSNSQYQGIDLSDDRNMNRIYIGAGNKDETETEDKAIADAYGNRFHILLDFELLETHMPFYQSALGDRLEYELTFNDYSRVVVVTDDAAATYTVENICLEFDMITQPNLARLIRNQYAGRLAILYDRVLRHRMSRRGAWRVSWCCSRTQRQPIRGTLRSSTTHSSRRSRWLSKESRTSCTARAWGLISFGKRSGSTSLLGQSDILRSPRSRRISSWPTYPWGGSDHEALPLAGPPHYWWWPAPWQWAPGWECLRGCHDPYHEKRPRPPALWRCTSMFSWMLSWTSKMAALSQCSIELCSLPTSPHSAIVCGQTGCGKTVFTLDLLEGPYRGVFRHIFILCPTILHNKTYKDCPWI